MARAFACSPTSPIRHFPTLRRATLPVLPAGCLIALLHLPQAVWSARTGITTSKVQQDAHGLLSLLGFIAAPDMTGSSLNIQNARSRKKALLTTQRVSGFAWSADLPISLEGGIGSSLYDPKYLVSDGLDETETLVPARWSSLAGTLVSAGISH